MQNAIRKGIPFHQGPREAQGKSGQPRPAEPIPVAVSYRDGAVLTFLFDRATPIRDLSALIRRAGQVRKVVL
ncbi:hypothetical protein MQE22_12870 [Acidithiobacillus sp. YTS05]|uniref:hypothetical protein n=1 Tax=Acidithiobacillus caldus TaxID=33059 RepID=UPI001C07343F|nr:hypothetical protein [Acidithiobacillus caldus]MBU2789709.1 hypothetical protein [Acidithiobacillus caldus]MBU2822337.1 hypothetical protein [Acidithiobacillus caldus]UTV80884.1 hypothetical protein MQE22_12870 [Acidithiobacillus sp. YTS05]